MVNRLLVAGALLLASSLASPVMAASEPATRLVSCGVDSCLQVSGHRHKADMPIAINGHPVAVEGKRAWHISLPLSLVRAWSEPFARSITISTGQADRSAEASLPIGLLGHRTDLASLVVRAR